MRPIYLFSISSHPEAIHIDPLDITFFTPRIDFDKYDHLVITSKQAVKALQNYDKTSYIGKKALCISKASAAAYEAVGGEVLAVGKGYGDTLYDSITKYPKTTKWLYLRAQEIASDFAKRLNEEGYDIQEVVVYKSECSSEILQREVANDGVLIFTSPSSVKCYLKNHAFTPNQDIVVIGKTTAKTIPKNVRYVLSGDTSVQSCVEIAKKLAL